MKIIKRIVLLACLTLIVGNIFSILFPTKAEAFTYTFIACDDNPGTVWEVWYRYLRHGGGTRGPFFMDTRNGYISYHLLAGLNCGNNSNQGMEQLVVANGDPRDDVQWSTACVDPIEQALLSSINGAIYQVDVTFYTNSPGANLRKSGTVDSRGNNRGYMDFYETCIPRYEIEGYVFVDENRDGNRDGGEPYYNTGNTAVDKWGDYFEDTGTNSNGYFRFYNLPPRSDYGVRLNVPSGYVCTTSNNCRVGCQSQGCGSSGINLPPSRTYYFGIAPDRPDLVVSSFTFPGGSTAVSTSDPTVVIRNQGNRSVTNTFSVRVCNGDGACRTENVGSNIAPGDSLSLSSRFTNMPRPSTQGNWTARATVDYGNDVTEANEGNNTRDDAYSTTRPAPDLVVNSSFRYPGGNESGTSDPTVVIRNAGTAVARAGFSVRVDNNVGSGGNTRTRAVAQDLAPGDSLNVSSLFTGMPRPPARTALYTARATVDFYDEVNESNESNNTREDEYRISNTPLPDLELVTIRYLNPAGTLSAPAGSTTNPTFTFRNTGNAAVTADFDVRICNGNAFCELRRITQTIPVSNTTTNVSSLFVGMPVPGIVGDYLATFTVDYGNVIDELNEGNNRDQVDYSTTGSALSAHTISGGVFDDLNRDGQKGAGENYINGTFSITGGGGFTPINLASGATGFTTPPTLTASGNPYTVTMISALPANYAPTYPSTAAPQQQVRISVGSACNAGDPTTHLYALCDAGDNVVGLDFGVAEIPPPAWFQGVGGDIRTDQGIVNEIPTGSSFAVSGTNLTSGVVFGSPTYNVGSGDRNSKSSSNNWFVYNRRFAPSTVKTSYEYMRSTLEKSGQLDNARNLTCTGSFCTFNTSQPGVYVSGNTVISSSLNFTGGDHIFLIDGNLTINNNITVPQGSTAIFIVNGDIRVDSDVTRIEGIYSADGTFIVQGIGDGRDNVLEIHGNVIGNALKTQNLIGFRNDRSRSEIDDNAAPSVRVIFRPDFILNAPELIRTSNFKIQELAPGAN